MRKKKSEQFRFLPRKASYKRSKRPESGFTRERENLFEVTRPGFILKNPVSHREHRDHRGETNNYRKIALSPFG